MFENFKFTRGPLKTSKDTYEFFMRFLLKVFLISTVNGFKQLALPRRHWIESVFWINVLLLGFIGAFFCASLFWIRFLERPTVMTLDTNYMNWNTTFPAFTFCYKNKMNETALKIYLNTQKPENRVEMEYFLRKLVNLTVQNLDTLPNYRGIPPTEYVAVLSKITKKINTSLISKHGIKFELYEMFTKLGICFTCNSYLAGYFSFKYIYKGVLDAPTPIFETSYIDPNNIAYLQVNDSFEIYYHNSHEMNNELMVYKIPSDSSSYTEVVFSAIPIFTDPVLKSLLPFQRKCRFSDESNLNLYKSFYSYDLCKYQCLYDIIIKYCNCIPFFFQPNPKYTNCYPQDFKCISFIQPKIKYDLIYNCDCLYNCNYVRVQMISSKTTKRENDTLIRIELKMPKFRINRKILYGLSDVITMSGATFGLFLGLSSLSLVELVFLWLIHFPRKYLEFRALRQKQQEKLN